MTTFTFAPATRETAKARIALQGPGGSGKTKTALRMAEGLAKGGQIGLVDTERGSALKYAPFPAAPTSRPTSSPTCPWRSAPRRTSSPR